MSNVNAPAAPALVLKRTFKAPRARVFSAWTQPEIIAKWFGPEGMTVPEVSFEARVGGSYRIVMLDPSDGERNVVGGVIRECVAPERLVYTWRWEQEDPAKQRDTLVTVLFHDRGTETEVELTHENLFDETSRAQHESGWSQTLDKLARLDLS